MRVVTMGRGAFEGGRTVRQSGIFLITPRAKVSAETPDGELVLAMLANDEGGWREFQRRYDRLVHRCITKVTRRFARVVMQDDVREIYATFLLSLFANDMHKLRSFDGDRGNRFSSWLGLLAVNAAYDHLRSLKREPGKVTLSEAYEVASDLPDPFEHTAQREYAAIAARALADFSERDRAFAALYYAEGMEPEEIAESLNISVKTVYSKKHKIEARLGSALRSPDESGVRPALTADDIIAA